MFDLCRRSTSLFSKRTRQMVQQWSHQKTSAHLAIRQHRRTILASRRFTFQCGSGFSRAQSRRISNCTVMDPPSLATGSNHSAGTKWSVRCQKLPLQADRAATLRPRPLEQSLQCRSLTSWLSQCHCTVNVTMSIVLFYRYHTSLIWKRRYCRGKECLNCCQGIPTSLFGPIHSNRTHHIPFRQLLSSERRMVARQFLSLHSYYLTSTCRIAARW